MKTIETNLPGVVLLEPQVFGDERGFFIETYHGQRFTEWGVGWQFVQDNQSRSSRGVLRGLHYQLNHPQGKLVRVTRGEVYDVAVDIRVGSPTFGESFGAILNDTNHHQLFIPPGFAHGFCVLSDTCDFVYKCTDYYHPEDEGGILWNDPALNIAWPISDVQLSEKDTNSKPLAEVHPSMLPKFKQEAVA